MKYDTTHNPLLVLLADDDEDDRNFFKEAIDALSFKTTVETVNDGQELMDYLNQPNASLPNLLFLDLNMPRKNGLECLQEIRRNKNLKNISIAIYSTSEAEKDINESFIHGANVYIKKPHDFNKLKQAISEVLNVNWQYHTNPLNRENFLMVV